MSPLLKRVAQEQDAALARDEARLSAIGARLRRGPARQAQGPERLQGRPARVYWAYGALLASVALLIGGLAWRLGAGLGAVTLVASAGVVAPGSVVDASAGEIAGRFSDGSTLLARTGARVRLLEVRGSGATLLVERGATSVFVQPRKDTDYRFEAGPYRVLVTGTRFDLSWDPARERLELAMQSGAVELRGPGLEGGRTVVAGQSVVLEPQRVTSVEPAKSAAPAAPPPPEEPAPLPTVERTAGSVVVAPAPSGAPEGPSWKQLQREGKYKEAYALVAPSLDGLVGTSSAGDLLLLADVARLAGHGGQATSALETLRRRFPRTPEASQAAFHLGRAAGSGPGAATWFRAYLSEAPSGSFAREALGRLLECHHRSGERAAATQVAKQYLGSYPKGPHAELARTYADGAPAGEPPKK